LESSDATRPPTARQNPAACKNLRSTTKISFLSSTSCSKNRNQSSLTESLVLSLHTDSFGRKSPDSYRLVDLRKRAAIEAPSAAHWPFPPPSLSQFLAPSALLFLALVLTFGIRVWMRIRVCDCVVSDCRVLGTRDQEEERGSLVM